MEDPILRIAFLLCLVGCVRGSTGFVCADTASCNGGTCESTGFCSFSDGACESGRRYGSEAGMFSNQCVDVMVDAGVDSPIDTTPAAPVVTAHANDNTGAASSLSYLIDIPAGANRFLLVSAHLGGDCMTALPDITAVTFNGISLTQVASQVGTPCQIGGIDDTFTRTDQWQLIDPPTGTNTIVVTLSAVTTFTIHSGAIAFSGVNQTSPIRASAKSTFDGTASLVKVDSAPGDLVVDTVATGGMFTGPDASQVLVFQNNASGNNTLDNSAASTKPGEAGMVSFSWTGDDDEWQDIASSIRP